MCISRLTPHPARAGVVFALAGACDRRGEPFLAAAPTLFRTTDGGRTWTAAAKGLSSVLDEVSAIAPSESAPDTVYVKSRTSLWRSLDGGATAARIGSLLAGPTGPDDLLVVDPKQKDVLYMSHGGTFSKSTDGGETFRRPRAAAAAVDRSRGQAAPRLAGRFAGAACEPDRAGHVRDEPRRWRHVAAPSGAGPARRADVRVPHRREALLSHRYRSPLHDHRRVGLGDAARGRSLRALTDARGDGLLAASVDPRACDDVVLSGEVVWSSTDGGKTPRGDHHGASPIATSTPSRSVRPP